MNSLERVRSGCKAVAESAVHVRINHDLIPAYAASLLTSLAERPTLDPVSHYVGHGDDTVAFILTLDAINFGSGYFPHLCKRPGMSGYFTIASSLTDFFTANGPLSARDLQEITPRDCAEIFSQDLRDPVIAELMKLFSRALSDLGSYLIYRSHGSVIELVEEANHSAARLVDILRVMPLFSDEEQYRGMNVPFYKRAQITTSDLALAFNGKGPGEFHDLDRLTIFADNMVPHVLRVDGILSYDEDLLVRIEREELIPAGSEEEIEIRACAVHAVELIVTETSASGKKITSQQLDNALWNRGQNPDYKAISRHRTRSVYY
ncbi:MAG TPA: hypothetical protein ENH11_06520 [Candidatus Acetothermia bacterium]|nr:hypothetical protein [Candidatus Acetothermia bacterium]